MTNFEKGACAIATITVKNGLDVDRLVETIEAIKEDANLGAFTFRARSRWENGTHSVGEISGFTHAGSEDETRSEAFALHGDEPPVLLGSNQGPNAVELVLQALAFCYAVGYVANAAAQGIEITRMDYEIEGDLDVRPFLGLDGPRPALGSPVSAPKEPFPAPMPPWSSSRRCASTSRKPHRCGTSWPTRSRSRPRSRLCEGQ